jgi:hypothetical protein
LKAKKKNHEVIITNVFGEIIYSSAINSSISEIDLSKYSRGIYFLQLKTSEGTAVRKIVKE